MNKKKTVNEWLDEEGEKDPWYKLFKKNLNIVHENTTQEQRDYLLSVMGMDHGMVKKEDE